MGIMADEAKPEQGIEAEVEDKQPSASVEEVEATASTSSNVPEDSAVQKDETETDVKSAVDAEESAQKKPEAEEKTPDVSPSPSGSKSDIRSVHHMEAGAPPLPPAANQERRCTRCGPKEVIIRFLLYFITVTFIAYFVSTFFDPKTPDRMHGQLIVGISIAVIVLFVLIILQVKEWNYDIFWPWNQMGAFLGRMRLRSSASESRLNMNVAGGGDIESQTTSQKDVELTAGKQDEEGATDKSVPQPCASVQNVPSTSEKGRIVVSSITSDICSVTKVYEVASSVSSVVSKTLAQETADVAQSEKASPEPKDESEEENSNGEVKRADYEPLSSGEIRRRKFKNVECPISSSSDEEVGKKD